MPFNGIKSRLNGRNIDEVREEFTQLYRSRTMTLRDIAEIFRFRGVNATLQQWKTQITLWNIAKNSKKSDMIFAVQKSDQRKQQLGKRTTFMINGQLKSSKDIQRFKKRHRKAIEESPEIAKTPEGVTYQTPPSYPDDPEDSDEYEELVVSPMLNGDSPKLIGLQDHSTYGTALVQAKSTRSSTSMTEVDFLGAIRDISSIRTYLSPIVRLPDDLHNVESALFAIKEFYGSRIEQDTISETIFQNIDNIFIRFEQDMSSYVAYKVRGSIYTAELHRQTILNYLPDLVRLVGPWHLPILLSRFVRPKWTKDQTDFSLELACAIERYATRTMSKDCSLSHIARAFISSSSVRSDLAEKCLLQASKFLIQRGQSYSQLPVWSIAMQRLNFIQKMVENWNGALLSAQALANASELRLDETMGRVLFKADSLRLLAVSQMELGKFVEAQQTLEKLWRHLETNQVHSYPNNCDYITFLAIRGELKRRMQEHGAIDDLHKAWQLSCQVLGIENGYTVERWQHLNDAISDGPTWVVY